MNGQFAMVKRVGVCALLGACATLAIAQDWSPAALSAEAHKVAEVCDTAAVVDWMSRAAELPELEPVVLHVGPRRQGGMDREVFTEERLEALMAEPDATPRSDLQTFTFGPDRYYATSYGTPIAYAPMLQHAAEFLATHGTDSFEGMKVLDFGYGQLGQVAMLARCGARVHGVEVDPLVHTLYEVSEAAGEVRSNDGRIGSISLYLGEWFGDEDFRSQTGDGFDLLLFRNVLKKGYVTPDVPMEGFDPIDVGGSPERGAEIIAAALAPGGIAIVYNLGSGPHVRDDGSYNNPADVRDPFGRASWEAAGLEVVVYEADGSALMREAGVAIGWAETVEELAPLNARYTLVRRLPQPAIEESEGSE